MRDAVPRCHRILGTIVVLALFYIDFGAALFTLVAVQIPTVPFFHFWMQGMTGPWQSGSFETNGFRAYGYLSGGERTEIDVQKYMPGSEGKRGMRIALHGYGRPYHYGDSPEGRRARSFVARPFYPEPDDAYLEERKLALERIGEINEQRIYREHLLPQLMALHNRDHPHAPIHAVTLLRETWPTSREGYEAKRREPYLKREVVAKYP